VFIVGEGFLPSSDVVLKRGFEGLVEQLNLTAYTFTLIFSAATVQAKQLDYSLRTGRISQLPIYVLNPSLFVSS
jgi:hypothetical protein